MIPSSVNIGGYAFPTALGRLLLHPDPGEGGAGAGATPPQEGQHQNQQHQHQPPAEGEQPPPEGEQPEGEHQEEDPPPSPEEFRRLQQQIKEQGEQLRQANERLQQADQAERQKRQQQREQERARHREAGDWDKWEAAYKQDIADARQEVEEANKRALDADHRAANTVVQMKVMGEFSKYQIQEGWLDHLMKLHAHEFEAIPHGDTLEVRGVGDAKALDSKVAEIMRRPEYKHIQRGKGGGTGSTLRNAPPPDQPQQEQPDYNRQLAEAFQGRRNGTLGTLAGARLPSH